VGKLAGAVLKVKERAPGNLVASIIRVATCLSIAGSPSGVVKASPLPIR
jgi:hypothetical protein